VGEETQAGHCPSDKEKVRVENIVAEQEQVGVGVEEARNFDVKGVVMAVTVAVAAVAAVVVVVVAAAVAAIIEQLVVVVA